MALRVVRTEKHEPGSLPGEDIRDPVLECREYRRSHLKKDDEVGLMCIGVQPGEALGEIRIDVQFEAHPDAPDHYNLCMKGQNKLLSESSEWLKKIFDELGGDWDVEIDAVPCPDAKNEPVALEQVSSILNGTAIEIVDGSVGSNGIQLSLSHDSETLHENEA